MSSDQKPKHSKPCHRSKKRKPTMGRDAWNERYDRPNFIWTKKVDELLADEVKDLAPGKALDLGSGEGRNAVWIADHGWNVLGVDISDVAIKKAKSLAESSNVSDSTAFQVEDLNSYTPQESSYDLVLLMFIHVSMKEMEGILKKAVKALKPGGTFLLVGHDATNIEHGVGGPQDPHMLYNSDDILSVIGKEIEVEKAGTFMRETAIDCLVKAKRL
ncbi:MAG: class I SAM-dependent methyltransferase [Bdellovibrionota bacterium]|nr:class I SAM-dependent methyltransferase [Bdellovibrionota bacterium]